MSLPHTARLSSALLTLVNGGTVEVASRTAAWQGMAMATRPSNAGGALIAFGATAGAVIGFPFQEATRGFLSGLALGAVAALLIWLRERRG